MGPDPTFSALTIISVFNMARPRVARAAKVAGNL